MTRRKEDDRLARNDTGFNRGDDVPDGEPSGRTHYDLKEAGPVQQSYGDRPTDAPSS